MFSEQKELLYGYPSDIEYYNKSVGITRPGCNSLAVEDLHQRTVRENSSLTSSGPLCLSWLQVILVRFPRIRKYPLKDLLEKPYLEPLGVLW